MASTVRVDDRLHARLREIAQDEHRPIGQVIEEAIEGYERKKFWQAVNESVDRLRADPDAWRAYQDEVALFEGGAMDGLEHEEPYYTPEEEEMIRGDHARTKGR